MDFLQVEDRINNISYNFECDDWFGNSSKDKKSSRILLKKNYTKIGSYKSYSSSSRSSSSSSSSSSSATSQNRSFKSKASSRTQSRQSKKEDNQPSTNEENIMSDLPIISNERKYSQSSTTSSMHSSSSTSSSSSSARSKTSERKTSSHKSSHRSSLNQERNLSIHAIRSSGQVMNSIEAVEKNCLEDLKKIIAEDPTEINRKDSKERSLLSIACQNGYEEIVKYFVDNNDSLINEQDVFGYFPVHFCAQLNNLKCLKILFDSGASLQIKNNEGETPLHLAAVNGHYETVEWLCDHKANFNIIDTNERTAYDLAVKYGHEEVANYLAKLMGKPSIEM